MMTRFALLLEYDGRPFSGWQRQADRPSVQGALEAAIAAIDGGERLVEAAGRTDSGVHATGQVAHADFQKPWSAFKLKEALNAHLAPQPIAVLAAAAAGPDFHARFAATERAYLYRIIDRRAPLTLEKGRAWRIPVALDTDAMAAAAQSLIGRHDFTTFRDAQCQAKDPVKTLDQLDVVRAEGLFGPEVRIVARARSFLHRQVRSMVGALAEVGRGHRPIADVARQLAARDRRACGQVAPPDGLYLTRVGYGVLTLFEDSSVN
jgi:tRNA pseudouridine38-40 synthase